MAGKHSTYVRNAELMRYKDKGMLCQRPSAADKLLRFLLQMLVVLLSNSLKAVSVPFGRLFAVYFWMGKSVISISTFLEKQLLKLIGWMSGTAFGRDDSKLGRAAHYYFGAEVKKWHVGLAALVMGSLAHGIVRGMRNQFDERLRRSRWLKQLMAAAGTYEEWRAHAALAEQLESETDKSAKGVSEYETYDRKLLLEKLRHLKRTRETDNPREMMLALRIDLIRNVANIAKSQGHRQNFVSIQEPIKQYIYEVQEQLEQLTSWPETELPLDEKVSFFKVTRHAYGRTALLLSGGGGLGTFHLGVCKALFERKLLPRVLAGSSVGSIVCAVVGTRTDEELKKTFANLDKFDIGLFQNSTAMDLVRYAVNKGHLQDISYMVCKLRQLLGDCTFLEAFERTGRILNVTVCPADTNEPPRLLNYMTAPQALVWSAVAASSAFPGLYPPQHLLGRNTKGENIKLHGHGGSDVLQRRWRDGSLELDLPVQTLAEMFNCNHFLVSQTNPHIVPLLNFKSIFPRRWASIMEAELKHRLQVVQWMLPDWKISKWLTLFTQPWEGDITFTLPSMLWNLRKTIVNPSTLELMRATQIGEHATWERMSSIECNCSIEAMLDMCAAKLQNRARANGMSGNAASSAALGGKVPSWLSMPPVPPAMPGAGMRPASRSWGDGIADNDSAAGVVSWGDFQNHVDEFGVCNNSNLTQNIALMNGSLNASGSRVFLPPLHRPPLYYGINSSPTGELYEPDGLASPRHVGYVAEHRLPPIPSSRSSDEEDLADGFDSASSINAVRPIPRATSLRGVGASMASVPSGSTGISRRSSVMRGLNTLADQEGVGSGSFNSTSGNAASKSALACSSGVATATRQGASTPMPTDSARSSISLPEVGGHSMHQMTSGSVSGNTVSAPQAIPSPRAHPYDDSTRTSASESENLRTPGPSFSAGIALGPLRAPDPREAGTASRAAGSAQQGYTSTSEIGFGTDAQVDVHASPMRSRKSAKNITEQELLALASMDIHGMADDLWGTLLPLAGTSEKLAGHRVNGPAGVGTAAFAGLSVNDDGSAIDFLSY